jgi:hypothetical protein
MARPLIGSYSGEDSMSKHNNVNPDNIKWPAETKWASGTAEKAS